MGLFTRVLDLFFPPRCVFCSGVLPSGKQTLCGTCPEKLPKPEGQAVFQTGDFYSDCISPLYYEGPVQESIHRFKFEGKQFYHHTYGPMVAACIAAHYTGRFDVLSWVPVSKKRLRKRGYDQAKLLAVSTAKALEITPTATLTKTKDAAAQSSLGGKDQRRANISGAYQCLDPAIVAGKRVLLIDDVVTTGATLSESARCLLMAGAEEVLCATLARTMIKEKAQKQV